MARLLPFCRSAARAARLRARAHLRMYAAKQCDGSSSSMPRAYVTAK